MHETPQTPERIPIFKNMPGAVLALTLAIIGTYLVQVFAGARTENWLFLSGAVMGGPDFAGFDRPFGDVAPLFLHVFLHGGFFHIAMNMAMLLSLGPIVAMGLGNGTRAQIGFLVFFFFCALGGAMGQLLVYDVTGTSGLAIGASSAISGLLPAVGYLRGGWTEAARFSVPWILINIALAFAGDLFPLPIAWAAHLGGLAAGFAFPVFLALIRR